MREVGRTSTNGSGLNRQTGWVGVEAEGCDGSRVQASQPACVQPAIEGGYTHQAGVAMHPQA